MPDLSANLTRFGAFSQSYDAVRPRPPASIRIFLMHYWQNGLPRDRAPEPPRVLDLGAGTGLSTVIWKEQYHTLYAAEPDKGMRKLLKTRLESEGIRDATILPDAGHQISLANDSVDIVTASQAFHWMDPAATVTELCRVLAPGGLLAAYDCDWPVLVHPDLEAAYEEFFHQLATLRGKDPDADKSVYFPKSKHLENLKQHGDFRYVAEACIQATEYCDESRYKQIAYSQGGYRALVAAGYSPDDLHQGAFETAVSRCFAADGTRIMWVNYRIRFASMPA